MLRDTARYGVMAVGMTFVIVNKDLDLSVGSIYGLTAVTFATLFAPSHYNLGVIPAVLFCLVLGAAIGLINGLLVTVLKVPAFIATLTTLLIGRGLVLGLTGGKAIYYPGQGQGISGVFPSRRNQRFRIQQPDRHFRPDRGDRRLRARQDPLGL